MRITRLTLSNFRSFGPDAAVIDLVALTTFVGSNACGKTAVLSALARLFGMSPGDRGIRKSDFHVPAGTSPEDLDGLKLWIEARIDFPELADGEEWAGSGVPDCFRQMVVDAPKETPYCRVRLEASWTRSSLPEGGRRGESLMGEYRRRGATRQKAPHVGERAISHTRPLCAGSA